MNVDQVEVAPVSTNIGSMITTLHSAGAMNFLVWNVPDIGLAPALNPDVNPDIDPNAAAFGTSIAQMMNAALEEMLAGLQADLLLNIIQFDLFNTVRNIVFDPEAFGLENATFPCAVSVVCDEPEKYFFWDGFHPTTTGHGLVAQALLQAIPEPAGTSLLGLGLAILWFGRWRRSI